MSQSDIVLGYHRSAYWGSWSRVLEIDSDFVWQVDLTPSDPKWESSWQDIKNVRIRRCMTTAVDLTTTIVHYSELNTVLSDQDIRTHLLPPEIKARMIEEMGEQVATNLLSVDYMKFFHKEVFSMLNNSGAYIKDLAGYSNM